MAVFVPYKEAVEITGLTHDNTYRNSGDLSGLLQNPSATGILVKIQNHNAGAGKGGAFGVGFGGDDWYQEVMYGTAGAMTNVVPFQLNGTGASNTGLRQVRYNLENALVKVWILGEFHAGIAWHSFGRTVNPTLWGDSGDWIDRTVYVGDTGDDVGDVEAVILTFTSTWVTAIGLRAKGSANADIFNMAVDEQGMGWEIVKVDANGEYQVNILMKEDPFAIACYIKEVGYIRKGAGYTAIEDPQETGDGAVAEYTVTTIVEVGAPPLPLPESCRAVILKSGYLSGTDATGVLGSRDVGSTNSVYYVYPQQRMGCEMVNLNLEKEFEYIRSVAAFGQYVVGYQSYEPVEDTTTLKIDSGRTVTISGNSSGGVG